MGITSGNVGAFVAADNPEVRRFLGLEGGMAQALGPPDDWAVQVIKGIGNCGEIYDRNRMLRAQAEALALPWPWSPGSCSSTSPPAPWTRR